MPEHHQWSYQYAAKFLCMSHKALGTSAESRAVVPGSYRTVVNIHNPHEHPIELRVKLALGDGDELISDFRPGKLGPDGMTRVDCDRIQREFFQNPFPHGIQEGFLVIESTHSLDVVAVYTAGRKWVRSVDVERVHERRLEHEKPPPSSCEGQHVANFEAETPGTRPNPLAVGTSMKFLRTAPAGPNLEIKTAGSGHNGLDCGNHLEVHFSPPVDSVEMVLVHFSQPATVVATGFGGMVVDGPKTMSVAQDVPEMLTLSGSGIEKVEVRSPQNEVLMLCLGAS